MFPKLVFISVLSRTPHRTGGRQASVLSSTCSTDTKIAKLKHTFAWLRVFIRFNVARQGRLGYRLAATFERAFLNQLPASFALRQLRSSSGAVRRFDLGSDTHAYRELNFRNCVGFAASLGDDYTGNSNWTNGPAFTAWSSMLRYDFHNVYRAQSIENLFDHNTGTK